MSVLIAPLFLSGCAGLTEKQKAWIVDGERAFQRDQYDQSIRSLTDFLNEAKDQPEIDRALYVRGMAFARTGRRSQAYSDLRRCVETGKDPQVKWRAALVLGALYFEDSDWRGAATSYGNAVNNMPGAPPKDLALYRLGQSNQRMGRWSAALDQFQQVISAFPRGEFGESARRVVDVKPSAFYIQSGVFGQQRNAENQAVTLQQAGFTTNIRSESRDARPIYVVLVGPFTSYAQARSEWGKVRGYAPDSIIWP